MSWKEWQEAIEILTDEEARMSNIPEEGPRCLTLEGQAEYEEWYANFKGIIDAEIAWHASRELCQKRIDKLEALLRKVTPQ